MALALSLSPAVAVSAPARPLPDCLEFARPPTPALQAAAAAGDVGAQTRLGTLYASGLAVPRDVARALPLLTAAARRGDARAQYQLGKLYAQDLYAHYLTPYAALRRWVLKDYLWAGSMPDERMARHWYRQAAEQGYVPAMWALSALEAKAAWTSGGPQSGHSRQWAAQIHQRSLHWLVRAADAGFAPAQLELVENANEFPQFRLGMLLPHAPPGSVHFGGESRRFQQALSHGFGLINEVAAGTGVTPGIAAPSDVAQANWTRLLIAMPVAYQTHGLDALDPRRQGIPGNPQRALAYLEGRAIAGDRAALTDLGNFYQRRDPALARALFKRAAARGDAVAEWELGVLLDPSLRPWSPLMRQRASALAWQPTIAWWTRAAEQGDALAALSLARHLIRDESQDAAAQTRAAAWLLIAAARWPQFDGFREDAQRELRQLMPRLDAAQRAQALAFATHTIERIGCTPRPASWQAAARSSSPRAASSRALSVSAP